MRPQNATTEITRIKCVLQLRLFLCVVLYEILMDYKMRAPFPRQTPFLYLLLRSKVELGHRTVIWSHPWRTRGLYTYMVKCLKLLQHSFKWQKCNYCFFEHIVKQLFNYLVSPLLWWLFICENRMNNKVMAGRDEWKMKMYSVDPN